MKQRWVCNEIRGCWLDITLVDDEGDWFDQYQAFIRLTNQPNRRIRLGMIHAIVPSPVGILERIHLACASYSIGIN